jgi:hypothetical protein
MENSYSEANSNTKIVSCNFPYWNWCSDNVAEHQANNRKAITSRAPASWVLRWFFSQKVFKYNIRENLDINCRFYLWFCEAMWRNLLITTWVSFKKVSVKSSAYLDAVNIPILGNQYLWYISLHREGPLYM